MSDYIKACSTCDHYPNDKHCIGCEWDKSKGENSKWKLKENPIVIERKVLEQIRDELHATAEMHEDGDYYLRDEWIDEYFDKYTKGE